MVRPSAVVMNEPLAWFGKATWATAVTTSGIQEAGHDGHREQEGDGGPEPVAKEGGHRSSYARLRADTTRSIALIPMNGAMSPPTP